MMNRLEVTGQCCRVILEGFKEYFSFRIYLDPFRSIRHKALLYRNDQLYFHWSFVLLMRDLSQAVVIRYNLCQ